MASFTSFVAKAKPVHQLASSESKSHVLCGNETDNCFDDINAEHPKFAPGKLVPNLHPASHPYRPRSSRSILDMIRNGNKLFKFENPLQVLEAAKKNYQAQFKAPPLKPTTIAQDAALRAMDQLNWTEPEVRLFVKPEDLLSMVDHGIFAHPSIEVYIECEKECFQYSIHMPIALELCKHNDSQEYTSIAKGGRLFFNNVIPSGFEQLLHLLYASHTPGTASANIRWLISEKSPYQLCTLYVAASYFKLENIKDLVLCGNLDCYIHNLLSGAEVVYQSKYLDDKFRDFFKTKFVHLLKRTIKGRSEDITAIDVYNPKAEEFKTYQEAIAAVCASGGQLATDVVSAILHEFSSQLVDMRFSLSVLSPVMTGLANSNEASDDGSFHSDQAVVDADSQHSDESCTFDGPQVHECRSPSSYDENSNVDVSEQDTPSTDVMSPIASTIGVQLSDNSSPISTMNWDDWDTAINPVPKPLSPALARQTVYPEDPVPNQTIIDDNLLLSPPTFPPPAVLRPAKPVAHAPLYTLGPRLDSWTAYAITPSQYIGNGAIAVRASNNRNCTLKFKIGDSITNILAVNTPFPRPLRLFGSCHGLRGSFPASYVRVVKNEDSKTAPAPAAIRATGYTPKIKARL